ncbi:MAG: D-glycero-alpha-D-manno-heptose-1,7-bisphosphate 7-phosphatase [Rhodanobacteraceae bacterium]
MLFPVQHVILDRDGVLNAELPDGGYVTEWSQWQWLPGAREGLKMLSAAGVRVSVATNQAGVGRGIMDRAGLDAIHAHMVEEAALAGGAIDGVFVCPHTPDDGCHCRKPAPGLLIRAVKASGISRQSTIMVGDALRDLEAARGANLASALVRTGKGHLIEAVVVNRGVPAFANLREFAEAVRADSTARVTTLS